jgi:hypothetical protein
MNDALKRHPNANAKVSNINIGAGERYEVEALADWELADETDPLDS